MTQGAFKKIDNLLNKGHLPHTLIIEGDGDEKLKLARYVAKAALCEQDKVFCDNCRSCHLADAGTHPDIKTLSCESKNYSVDTIRELRKEAFLTPFMSDGRVFIIEQAEKISAAGQNALLKILEEPPRGVHFILVTENSSALLETVVSRAVIITADGDDSMDEEMRSLCMEIFKLSRQKNKIRLLKIFMGYGSRVQFSELLDSLKTAALGELKNKYNGGVTDFTLGYYLSLLDFIERAQKAMVLNPPLKLLSCLLCDALTES